MQARTVAYLNVDTAVKGNYTLYTGGVYSLSDVVYEAAKVVPNPDGNEIASGHPTVYDTWLARDPEESMQKP